MKQVFVFEENREAMMARMNAFLLACLPGKRIKVTVEKYVKRRTLEQNAYLRGYVYPTILKAGGEAMKDLDADDIHRLMLMHHFGTITREVAGQMITRPARTSSTLSTTEFSEYIASIQQFWAEQGLFIDDPTDMRHE